MKKLVKWVSVCTAAGLLFCGGAYAQTEKEVSPQSNSESETMTTKSTGQSGQSNKSVTVEGKSGNTVTVERLGPQGYNVCYFPVHRHVQGSRVVRRCGNYGCQDFRVTRDFYVRVNTDCHMQVNRCSQGSMRYGTYPSKYEARNAVNRCEHTLSGDIPHGWNIMY